jgi:hypothetical protein
MFVQIKSYNFYIFTSLVFLISYFLNFNNYIGNKFLFFIFQLSSFALFLTAIKKNNSSFEFFTYFFFLLSFWFKYNCILYFENINVTEGDFNLTISNYDNSTFVIIIVFISCILTSFVKKFIFEDYIANNKFELNHTFIIFYKRYRIFIYLLFCSFLIFIWITNFYYKIYSKGLVNENVSLLIKYFYSWNLNYGLAVLTSILIYIDFLMFKNQRIFIFGIFESFFTQMNIYSRSFILYFLAYLRGFLQLHDAKNFTFSKLLVTKIVIIFLIISFLSIFSANKLRNNQFYNYDKAQTSITLLTTFSDIFNLSINRWVGIDALLAVSQSKNLNFKFFLSAFHEKKNIKEKSFYNKNFFKRFENSKFENKNLNLIVTPGIVAFLYYSGSAFFVFFSISILILICSYIEMLFYHFSLCNIILANIIGYALALRFIHFGYVPINTINFILSFIITLFFVYIFTNLIIKKIKINI